MGKLPKGEDHRRKEAWGKRRGEIRKIDRGEEEGRRSGRKEKQTRTDTHKEEKEKGGTLSLTRTGKGRDTKGKRRSIHYTQETSIRNGDAVKEDLGTFSERERNVECGISTRRFAKKMIGI